MSSKIPVAVYVCDECGELFIVGREVEPTKCSVCGSEAWEWSHDGYLVEQEVPRKEEAN